VVQPGDCLWLIAERALGSDANDEQIAAAVDRLWQRNADRIATGDPDLIHPGQTLDLP
jgi:nucleoid-associated protein YgaU